MKLRFALSTLVLAAAASFATPSTTHAQGEGSAHQVEPAAVKHQLGPADIIMPHITDSRHIELPCFKSSEEWACEKELPTWKVNLGGTEVDLSPTKHVVFMALAGLLTIIMMLMVAAAHKRHSHESGRPKGFAAGIEAIVLYLRNEIYMPVLGGHGGSKYVPFCLSLFFFIAFCNLFGLVPYGSTPTGNIAVTLTLALITFVVVEVAGMRALGKGYLGTIVYWPHEGGAMMKAMTIIMTPVEIAGKISKPFALTIRLFANMIAGHVIILSLIGLIFMFGFKVAVPSIAMALFIMFLEILVAFIQAFIFSLLAAVFIGQIRSAHH
jgi:F-type H+-transporting ATPase subunit a